jgi:Holliday junction resolvase
MSIHRRAAKRDANEPEIIAALRAVGASVDSISGKDVPDLIVGFRGVNYLIEVKYLSGKLTKGQYEWHENWKGQRAVVWNSEQALQIIGAIDKNEIE